MKKLIKMGLIVLMLLSLVGCGDEDISDTTSNAQNDVIESYTDDGKEITNSNDNSNLMDEESVDLDKENIVDATEKTDSETKDTKPVVEEIEPVVEETKPVIEEPKVVYNIADTNLIMYAVSTANVRNEPDKNATKLGTLSQNDEVIVTGIVYNGWYRINYNEQEGFVKENLLSTEKKVDQETSSENKDSSENGSSSGTGNGTGVTVPSTGDTEGDLVWIPTNGGTKYHSKSSCSKMNDPMQVTKEHAEKNGFTPCKRCY